ncbi:hypothetical protein MYCTH_2301343 [Thermothelomyces thermophilus ATCC 42464]|uniref:Uncharacterized protein n=1 Tax=Thermothelomyces thermophilus (strain ATCC 42464 / BCRC 31852 / DSM 1799) TaxID=573729 RepID=G2Q9G6_THET4|nr:uncharacterized protein MYCTH_2301343 [Thermothelomyces thermophilus ATCC 42464]AEO56425.1 hypothetical protein MYCTH_2301343 [Thermothelomyces thermophilus ATCC 42464]
MAAHTVKLLRPSALQLDANTPCVLEIHMPMTLPHRLDPSLPAPPYHAGTITAEDFRDDHAMPLLRGLMAQIAAHMLGPEYAAATLAAQTTAKDDNIVLRLLDTWDGNAVTDRAGFDFAAGYWRDMHGKEGHGTIYAYEDMGDRIEVIHGFKFHLVCGIREAERLRKMNPRVVRFDVEEDGGSGGVWILGMRWCLKSGSIPRISEHAL